MGSVCFAGDVNKTNANPAPKFEGTTLKFQAKQDTLSNGQLLDAVKRSDLQRVRSVLTHGANVNCRDAFGRTALMLTVTPDRISKSSNDIRIARYLIQRGANVNLTDKSGTTALMYACSYSKAQMVRLLLNNTSNVEIQNHEGSTPLILASSKTNQDYNSVAILELVLLHHAKVDNPDNEGKTPLMYAASMFNVKFIKMLIEYGAKVNAKAQGGLSP